MCCRDRLLDNAGLVGLVGTCVISLPSSSLSGVAMVYSRLGGVAVFAGFKVSRGCKTVALGGERFSAADDAIERFRGVEGEPEALLTRSLGLSVEEFKS